MNRRRRSFIQSTEELAMTVIPHPLRDVTIERQIADSPEAQALQDAICKAIDAYVDYLDRHGLIYGPPPEDGGFIPAKGPTALVVTKVLAVEIGDELVGTEEGIEIDLKGGPSDRYPWPAEERDPD